MHVDRRVIQPEYCNEAIRLYSFNWQSKNGGVYDAVNERKIDLKDCLRMMSSDSLDFVLAIDDKPRFALNDDHKEVVSIATYADLQLMRLSRNYPMAITAYLISHKMHLRPAISDDRHVVEVMDDLDNSDPPI